jgi:hypothetical protein
MTLLMNQIVKVAGSPPPGLPHPLQLEVLEFGAYDLIVDARSPHEFEGTMFQVPSIYRWSTTTSTPG